MSVTLPAASGNAFLQFVQGVNADLKVKTIEEAFLLCERAHKNQFRKSGEPFHLHAVEVAKILVEQKMDTATICAGSVSALGSPVDAQRSRPRSSARSARATAQSSCQARLKQSCAADVTAWAICRPPNTE